MQPMVGLVETWVEELRGTKILVEVGGEFGGYGNYDDVDRNLDSIKLRIPTFLGKTDPEAYLEWEKRVDLIFDCHNF